MLPPVNRNQSALWSGIARNVDREPNFETINGRDVDSKLNENQAAWKHQLYFMCGICFINGQTRCWSSSGICGSNIHDVNVTIITLVVSAKESRINFVIFTQNARSKSKSSRNHAAPRRTRTKSRVHDEPDSVHNYDHGALDLLLGYIADSDCFRRLVQGIFRGLGSTIFVGN